MIAKKDHTGKLTYFHNDHLGSTQVITDTSGNLVENTSYDPWGEIAQGGTQSKFLYTGQENDPETNLHYYNARYYDPHIRRFIQPDDIIQNIYDPQSLNRYSYVRNNPIINTDPTGHYVETILDVGFIAWDVYELVQNPHDKTNWIALGADIGSAFIPGVTGVGLGIKIAQHGDDALKLANKIENTVDFASTIKKSPIFTKNNFRDSLIKFTKTEPKNAQAHHIFPQSKNLATYFENKVNKHNPKYGTWWDSTKGVKGNHQSMAKQYNRDWETYFIINPNATRNQILNKGKEMSKIYGLKVYY